MATAEIRSLGRDANQGVHDALLNANCTTLHSEDMLSGRRIDSLAIGNPFALPRRV